MTDVVSEVGRPDDGTDTGGFGNTEYFVDLKPKEQWRPAFHRNKDELIAAMNREVSKLPGAFWNFSQPIEDNVNETVTGTKGGLAVKIYGLIWASSSKRATKWSPLCSTSPALKTLAFSVIPASRISISP